MAAVVLDVPVSHERGLLCAWSRAPEVLHPSFVRGLAAAQSGASCEELVALWAWLLELPRPPKGCELQLHVKEEPWSMLFRPRAA